MRFWYTLLKEQRQQIFLDLTQELLYRAAGPIGLICIAVLRTTGIENIVAVDGNEQRLGICKENGCD